jgi:hypothetical protein
MIKQIKTYKQFINLFNKIDLNESCGVYLIINNKKSRVICSLFSTIETIEIRQAILNKDLFIEVLK